VAGADGDKGLSLRAGCRGAACGGLRECGRLVWALDNLLSQLQLHPGGGRITVAVYREDGEACVDVSDTASRWRLPISPICSPLLPGQQRINIQRSGWFGAVQSPGLLSKAHEGASWAHSELSVGAP